MYDKQVRRRRAILALLVGLSLILLTAYFGESIGGPLKTIQRGMLEVFSPIQEGASRALKPFKDLTNWVGDTFDAKDRATRLQKERDALRKQVIGADQARQENVQLKRMVNLNASQDLALSTYKPVTGRVVARSPSLWFTTITVDVGSSDGVHNNQPVVDGAGLVGKVTDVTSDAAIVTLITDHSSGVSSTVQRLNDSGILQTAAGNPNDLLLQFLPPKSNVKVGETVVTSGTKSSRLDSLFPPGIPIGTVTKADPEELNLYQRVHVKPFADLRRLDFVQVLTRPHAHVVVAKAGEHHAVNAPPTINVSLIVRLAIIGLVAVIVQITAISQISLLGVSADLTPLIVASVGLLAGSVPGAVMGFAMGLFVDTALVQTLGIDSLLLTGIGYGAGRLRELRDPSHTLVPVAIGAAATAISQIGYALIQFLLGVDAPVSFLLVREILFTIAVNTVLALPIYALVRRVVAPALPEDPRRRRARRASSVASGISPLSQPKAPRRRRRRRRLRVI